MSVEEATEARGLVVRCSPSGDVGDVVYDGIGLPDAFQFVEWLHDDDVGDGLAMLREIRHDQITVPWRLLTTDGTGGWKRLIYTGTLEDPEQDDQLIVVGVPEPTEFEAVALAASHQLGVHTGRRLEVRARSAMRAAPGERDADLVGDLALASNELASLHRELASSHAELEQANEQRKQLLGMVAHDLRNPLGSMVGFAQTLLAHTQDDLGERGELLMRRIEELGVHLLDVVDDLLDVSVIEHDELRLDLAEVDLAEVVRSTAETYRDMAAAKALELQIDVPSGPVPVDIDEGRIRQVLDNLFSNAVKYSPPGVGEVVSVRVEPGKDEVRVHVTDRGTGIPQEEQQLVFQLFGRVSTMPTSGERSIGLGLAIARNLAVAHGGRIDLASSPGEGSTFTLALPRQQGGGPN